MKLKYSIGQTVWTIVDGKAYPVIVTRIIVDIGPDGTTPLVQYTCAAISEMAGFVSLKRGEDKLFTSRKALIRAL